MRTWTSKYLPSIYLFVCLLERCLASLSRFDSIDFDCAYGVCVCVSVSGSMATIISAKWNTKPYFRFHKSVFRIELVYWIEELMSWNPNNDVMLYDQLNFIRLNFWNELNSSPASNWFAKKVVVLLRFYSNLNRFPKIRLLAVFFSWLQIIPINDLPLTTSPSLVSCCDFTSPVWWSATP